MGIPARNQPPLPRGGRTLTQNKGAQRPIRHDVVRAVGRGTAAPILRVARGFPNGLQREHGGPRSARAGEGVKEHIMGEKKAAKGRTSPAIDSHSGTRGVERSQQESLRAKFGTQRNGVFKGTWR